MSNGRTFYKMINNSKLGTIACSWQEEYSYSKYIGATWNTLLNIIDNETYFHLYLHLNSESHNLINILLIELTLEEFIL